MENLNALLIARTNSGRKQTLQFFRLPLVVMDQLSLDGQALETDELSYRHVKLIEERVRKSTMLL